MAADSDGPGGSLTTVVTCEGDLGDPEFPARFEQILNSLRTLVCEDATTRDRLYVRKLEPWNSVRVTLAIPREAALRLRQLASEGSQQLRALGILSVQVEGDQVISLRIAGMFGQEPQEIILRTGSEDVSSGPAQNPVPEDTSVASSLTRILTGASNTNLSSPSSQPSTSSSNQPSTSAEKVQFKSPNVVCPTDTQVPKPPPQATQASSPTMGSSQRNYNGPFPFASMTHAAQAIHNRENQTQLTTDRLATTASNNNSVNNNHPFNQPPPPYPSQSNLVKIPISNTANVAMSSPLLVNLLQNDGAQIQNKMLPPTAEQRKTTVKPPIVRIDEQQLVVTEATSNVPDIVQSSNSTFIPSGNSNSEPRVPVTSAIKYASQNNNVPMPHLTSNQNVANTSTTQIRNVGIRLAQPFVKQKINIQQHPVRPPIIQPTIEQLHTNTASQNSQIRQIRPLAQKFPNSVPTNLQFNNQFTKPNLRGQLNQFGVQQPVHQQQNIQQFTSPPPYPRQRGSYPEIRMQHQQPRPQGTWQFNSVEANLGPIGQPMPNLAGLSQNLQPIAQPMPHLGSLNPLLENNLSNITPSLTDLSKTDLDSLLPSLEPDVSDNTHDIENVPEILTSNGKRRQFLINPLTGELEPMPSESSSSESENEDGKDANDIFNDFNSPLNERSNSIYSDDDTCSTTISRKFDTTDQSDSEATVRSTNSENSVKSHQRMKSGKNRDRNRDSPSLKKNKDLQPEKIKLRLKLEKSEPVSPAYKVDVSFINTQQPKRAIQNLTKPSIQMGVVPCTTGEELRVPPLHISLRGRNSVVISSEKKKKYPKLNADGSAIEMKKSKKTSDSLKIKKSISAKDISLKSGSLLTTLSKSDTSLNQKANTLIKSEVTLPSTSAVELQKHLSEVKNEQKSEVKTPLKAHSDLDDLPLNYRIREPGEILPSKHQKFLSVDLKKSKKSNKFNHVDLYREQNLLSGGHMVDDFKSHRKIKDEKVIKTAHKTFDGKINSHLKKDKLCKERLMVGHVGEIRRGSDSDIVKGLKRHADSNGLLHTEKKRRLSQSDGKSGSSSITESQGVIKSVKLKPSSPERYQLSSLTQPIVGSTNVGTVSSLSNKTVLKTTSKLHKPVTKMKRDKTLLTKTKEGSTKTKDLNRDKTYSQNVAEKLAKQLPLPIGEIDMEAKFKQSLLESDVPRRHLERKFEGNKITSEIQNQQRVVDLIQTFTDRELPSREQERLKANIANDRQCTINNEILILDKKNEEIKTENDLRQNQRLDDKQSGRSPNSGGQGEDSGIESMDALSEKSPNQASQSPHCHTDSLLLTETTGITEIKTVKNEKLENCLTDLMDIEAQLAKLDGLPTLNGDISHMIKTEPFMKTETLIEKLEGTESKDLNENKERVKEILLDECCNSNGDLIKKESVKVDISELPLSTVLQDSLKQGNITVTRFGEGSEISIKNQDKLEINLVTRNFNCDETKQDCKIESLKTENDGKDLDFDPLPIRRKPPLYTYSNPEKQSRDSDSPVPNLSDLEYDNSDSNSEYSDPKSKVTQKSSAVTRRRKQNLDNLHMNDNELVACIEALETDKYLNDLTGFKKNDVGKKAPKSLLEQLLIEIPTDVSEKQISSISPSVSEKSLNACKSTIRTRSSSKLNSPDISDSKSEKCSKTPKHSPIPSKQEVSPVNSPVMCPKSSPKSIKTIVPAKRKRQESESSTQSNISIDEQVNNTRNKKARKCSENAVELIKACMGLDSTENKNITVKPIVKDVKKLEKNKLNAGLLRKSQLNELESSDSDEPLIEIAGKVRNKHVATRNKLNSTKINIPSPLNKTTVPVIGKAVVADEKIGTRRSVRNNSGANPTTLKTRSKLITPGEKTALNTAAGVSYSMVESDANRRKTRSAVSDDGKRRRNSRDDIIQGTIIKHAGTYE